MEAADRTDRLLLRGHIIKRCAPILNMVDGKVAAEPLAGPFSLWGDRRRA